MNKIIGRKEIEELINIITSNEKRILKGIFNPDINYSLKSESLLNSYNEKDYKEVFIFKYSNTSYSIYYYDIYSKKWCKTSYLRPIYPLCTGFYSYKDLERLINSNTSLDKDKIYMLINYKTFKKYHIFFYNKELEVWEEIFIGDNKEITRKITYGASATILCETIYSTTLYNKNNKFFDHKIITKEEFDKLILTCELVN